MLVKHFNIIIQSEKNTITFLKEKRLIQIDCPPCGHYGYTCAIYDINVYIMCVYLSSDK